MLYKHSVLSFAVLSLLLADGSFLKAGPPPAITVEAFYPGASAEVIADSVATPIEEQVNGIGHMVRMTSQCTRGGRYTLTILFEPGVDLNITQILVQNRVNLAVPVLPDEVKHLGVTVRKKPTGVLLLVTLLSADHHYDTLYLSNYAQILIKDQLARLPGVAEVQQFGEQDFGMHIWLDPDKLAARNLTATDVTRAIEQQNLKAAVGTSRSGVSTFTITPLGRLTEPKQFGDIILKAHAEGGVVRLRDVARIELGGGSSQSLALLDDKPVVALAVYLLPQARPRDVSTALQRKMAELKAHFPPGMDANLLFDFTPYRTYSDRPANADFLVANLTLPVDASPERTEKALAHAGKVLRTIPGVQHVLALSENPFDFPRRQPCLLVKLDPAPKPPTDPAVLRARLEKEIEDAKIRLCSHSLGGFPIDLALSSLEADQVRNLGKDLIERLVQSKKFTDVGSDPSNAPTPQLHVNVDPAKAARIGVSLADIFDTLKVYLGQSNVNDFNFFGRTCQVTVGVDAQNRDQTQELRKVKVRSAGGQMISLGSLAEFRLVHAPATVDRLDFLPMVEITANPGPGVSLAEARAICEALVEELSPSPACHLTWLKELPGATPTRAEPKTDAAQTPPPEVVVSRPISREITDYADYTGRTQAVSQVDIRARVTGYLDRVSFKPATEVKKGDLLFTIDARPYQAELDQAEAVVRRAEAHLQRTALALERASRLRASKAISEEEFDQLRGDREEAMASLKVAQASREISRLKVDFTRVTAPISGRIGLNLVTPGNLVKADDTLLAVLVSLDPMNVSIDLDERTYLRLRRLRLARKGESKSPLAAELPVVMGLADEKGYPWQGKIDSFGNLVDANMGTLQIRAVFPNPKGMLLPGLFVRIRLPVGAPHQALLIPESALGTDQGQKFVYLVDGQNKVVYRRVVIGPLIDDLRVIEEGLQPGDRVITHGLQRVRPGLTVKPKESVEGTR